MHRFPKLPLENKAHQRLFDCGEIPVSVVFKAVASVNDCCVEAASVGTRPPAQIRFESQLRILRKGLSVCFR